MDSRDPLLELLVHLVLLSLVAVGGLSVVLPELHRVAVTSGGWMTDGEFVALFALAQAAPGPNVLFATLLGWWVGGILGGVLATVAMCGPAAFLSYLLSRAWISWGTSAWFRRLQAGIVPVTVGLMIASASLVAGAAASSWAAYGIVGATAAVAATTRLHPIVLLAAGGALGVSGLV
jgi:chromate transporter